jgi:hypothetical protein
MLETFSFTIIFVIGLLAALLTLACEINNKKYTSKKK